METNRCGEQLAAHPSQHVRTELEGGWGGRKPWAPSSAPSTGPGIQQALDSCRMSERIWVRSCTKSRDSGRSEARSLPCGAQLRGPAAAPAPGHPAPRKGTSVKCSGRRSVPTAAAGPPSPFVRAVRGPGSLLFGRSEASLRKQEGRLTHLARLPSKNPKPITEPPCSLVS